MKFPIRIGSRFQIFLVTKFSFFFLIYADVLRFRPNHEIVCVHKVDVIKKQQPELLCSCPTAQEKKTSFPLLDMLLQAECHNRDFTCDTVQPRAASLSYNLKPELTHI